MTTRLARLTTVLAVGGAVLVLTEPWWRPQAARAGERLRVENFHRVRAGLPQAEVEELLGGPPGSYGRHAGGGWMMTCEGFIFPAKDTSVEHIWCDDDNRFEIYFDGRDRVAAAHRRASYQQTPRETLFECLLRQFRSPPTGPSPRS